MSDRFPGGVISKTPPTVTGPATSGPFAGEGGSASGVWSLEEQLGLAKAGVWPKRVLPRELYAWGSNGFGQLGDGTVVYRSSPVQVGVLTNWVQVESGYSSGAVRGDYTLWVWGYNGRGQLGQNDTIRRSSPVQVGALTNWSQISSGAGLMMAAIKTDGTLWTWGAANGGQLGLGVNVYRSSPSQVGALTNWSQVTIGNAFVVAVQTNGTLWSWGGGNNFGQQGREVVTQASSPIQVGSLTNWSQVKAGNEHVVSRKTDGTLWAWGRNQYRGPLGDGTTINRSSPVQVGALTNWSKVAAGTFSSASIKTDGTLWTWGYNNYGQVGDNTTVNKSSPIQVGSLTNWSQVSSGNRLTTATRSDGTLWAWGSEATGRLGLNDSINRSSPVQVGSQANWNLVSSTDATTLAITKG
jgi:alpha-tubulin suppressor-like RCC1 family protein